MGSVLHVASGASVATRFVDLDTVALLELVRAGDHDAYGELFAALPRLRVLDRPAAQSPPCRRPRRRVVPAHPHRHLARRRSDTGLRPVSRCNPPVCGGRARRAVPRSRARRDDAGRGRAGRHRSSGVDRLSVVARALAAGALVRRRRGHAAPPCRPAPGAADRELVLGASEAGTRRVALRLPDPGGRRGVQRGRPSPPRTADGRCDQCRGRRRHRRRPPA